MEKVEKEDIVKSVLAGSVGTSFMSLFSIGVSEKVQSQFKEHEIIRDMLYVLPFRKKSRNFLGWMGHYGAGVGFAFLNQVIQKKAHLKPGFFNGMIYGIMDAGVGIAIWKTIFVFHQSPPKIHLRKYFLHLLLAHVIFGAFSNGSFQTMNSLIKRA